MQASVAKAVTLLARNPLRIAILEFVLQRTQVSAHDVMAEFGLSRNGAGRHLAGLVDAGALTPMRERVGSQRWSTVWVGDARTVAEAIDDLDVFLLAGIELE